MATTSSTPTKDMIKVVTLKTAENMGRDSAVAVCMMIKAAVDALGYPEMCEVVAACRYDETHKHLFAHAILRISGEEFDPLAITHPPVLATKVYVRPPEMLKTMLVNPAMNTVDDKRRLADLNIIAAIEKGVGSYIDNAPLPSRMRLAVASLASQLKK